jgi:predicted dehydrogenase/acetyltransferase-like isoleucine patch superfamily enzyme
MLVASDSPTGNRTIAVIGCGYWGRNLVRAFNDLGVLVAIHDADPATATEIGERFGVAARPFEDILSDRSIEAVAIATPAVSHYDVARAALEADKHVFVEKPLALHVEDAVALCNLADVSSRVLMVGHLMRYHPAFVKLSEMVHGGELGELHYLYSHRLNLGKVRKEENILWSFAPHDISMILSLVGTMPEEVHATGGMYLRTDVADVTTTHLTFPGGEKAHIFVSWLHPFKEQKLVVVGNRAMAVLDDGRPWDSKLQLYPHQIDWVEGSPLPIRAEMTPVPVAEEEPLLLECRCFLDSISDGSPPPTDGQEGLRVLRVLAMAEASMSEAHHGRRQVSSADGIHESAYIDDDVEIGPGTKVWHFSHILSGTRIGSNCTIGQNVMVGPDVTIGDDCKIQNNVSIYKGVELEDAVFCGPSCVFTNVVNPRADIDRKDEFRRTPVRRGATIGANATIVCGNELGEHCFIAAGAVITEDVPAYALMAGVPARRIGWVSRYGETLDEDLICRRSGERYEVGDDGLLRALPRD